MKDETAHSELIYRQFLQGIAWRSVAEFLVRFRSIILLPILTRTLGKVDYGVWSQIGTSVGMLSSIGSFGIGGSMHRFLPGLPEKEMRQQFWMSIFLVTGGTLLVSIPFFIFAEPIANSFFGGNENKIFVYLGSILVITKVIQSHLFLYFRLSLKINIYSALLLFQSILSLVAYLIAALMGRALTIVAFTAVAVDVFLTIIVLVLVWRVLGFSKPDFSPLRKFLVFGLPTMPLAFLSWALNTSDRYIVAYFLGVAEVGVYSVAYGIALWSILIVITPIWTVLPGSINNLWNNHEKEKAISLLSRTFQYVFLLTTPVACVVIFWSDFILVKYAGVGFEHGSLVITLVVLAYAFEYTSSFYRFIFGWFEKTKIYLYTFSIAVVSNLLLNIYLVPRYGILGSAIATTVAYGVLLIFEVIISRRYLKPDFPVAASFAIVLTGVGLAYWISRYSHTDWISFFLQVSLFGMAYFLALWVLRLLDLGEIRALYTMLTLKKDPTPPASSTGISS